VRIVPFWKRIEQLERAQFWGNGGVTYARANAAVTFLDVLVAFIERTFGLQFHCHIATVAGASVDFRIFDVGGGFRTFERMWGVCGFEGFAVVGIGFEGPDVIEVTEGSCLLLLVEG